MKTGRMTLYGPPQVGIRFNNRIFREPVPLSLALAPVSSGIYAILVADASWRPRPFRVIYFGECHNFSQRVTGDHEHFNDSVHLTDAGCRVMAERVLKRLQADPGFVALVREKRGG